SSPTTTPLVPYTMLFQYRVRRVECEGLQCYAYRRGNPPSACVMAPAARSVPGTISSIVSLFIRAVGPEIDSAATTVPETSRTGRSEEHTSELQSRFDLGC